MNNDEPQPKNNKPKYKGKYRIDSTRLPAWSYASNAGYFVTICTDGKKCFFGEVVQGEMQRSPIGEIAHKLWDEIPNHFSNCQIDSFRVMPNHIHGILVINQTQEGDAVNARTQEEDAMNRVSTRGDGQRGGVTGLFNPMLCCLKIPFLKLLGGTKDDVHLKLIKYMKVLDGKEGFMTI
ncbi:hypothetical protein [Nostoc sp.]|uniref:hypothetical protein n=1 Tax=Nostoc sp. TaxID=1180 RepID=UPI002FFC1562